MIEQGSPEWFAQRCGKVTASRISDVIATTRSGVSTSRAKYMTQLMIERLTNTVAESYTNAAMEWGKQQEPTARAVFEYKMRVAVEEVGFVDHPYIEKSGASPDGYVGSNAILEIKCPNSDTHWETIKAGKIPVKYRPQIQWQLACTERDLAHFVSFDPRFPDELIYCHYVMERDPQYIGELEASVGEFLLDLERELQTAQQMMKQTEMVG